MFNTININYTGVGIQLFCFFTLLVLYIWYVSNCKSTTSAKSITVLLIVGMIRALNYAVLRITVSSNPGIGNELICRLLVTIDNLANVVNIICPIIYIWRRSGATSKFAVILFKISMYVGALCLALYTLNFFVPIFNWVENGKVVESDYFTYIYLMSLIFIVMPFIFVYLGRNTALPEERRNLILFALVPVISNGVFLFYWGDEIDPTSMGTTLLGILFVFYDRIQLVNTFRKSNEQIDRLTYEASHDMLTGLVLPVIFKQQVTGVLNEKTAVDYALAIVDVDGFKNINEAYGRPYGDKVLTRVSETLSRTLRRNDLIARMEGDEFAIFFRCDSQYFDAVVKKIRNCVSLEVDGVHITCCVGAVRVSDPDADYDYMNDFAYRALLGAKKEGSGVYRIINK